MAQYNGLVPVNITSFNAFMNEVNGNGYNVDGVYGNQCVDMAKLLAGNAGRSNPYWKSDPDGYAFEGWTVTSNRNYNVADYFELVYSKADVQTGDLVVLRATTANPYGHIAFATTNWDNLTTSAPLLGQNQVNPNPTTGHENTITNVNVTTFLGAFRFTAWNSTPPTPPPPINLKKSKFPWVLYANKLRKRRQGL